MQLKYKNEIKNKVISMELETVNFTKKELVALEKFGEPRILFEKQYEGKYPVVIDKRIRSGFKVRVKFDGTEDIMSATVAANEFRLDIVDHLESVMRELMDKLYDLEREFKTSSGFYDINY